MKDVDEQIKKDLVDQFYWDPRVDASDIKVEVNDGRVTLSGTVPTYPARQSAEMDCFSIFGVTSVENDLDVKPASGDLATPDEEIQEKIRTFLEWNPGIDVSHIRISVVGGLVTLEGSVDAYWKREIAAKLAASIPEVSGVRNKLAVTPIESSDDKRIADTILAALNRNMMVPEQDIQVEVTGGRVTLSGKVPNWIAYKAVEDAAQLTAGVVDVQNQVSIEKA
jgi:osmotically-inducible protein OsmY